MFSFILFTNAHFSYYYLNMFSFILFTNAHFSYYYSNMFSFILFTNAHFSNITFFFNIKSHLNDVLFCKSRNTWKQTKFNFKIVFGNSKTLLGSYLFFNILKSHLGCFTTVYIAKIYNFATLEKHNDIFDDLSF